MGSFSRKYLLIVALLLVCSNLSAQINSDFASNADGWTTPNDADGTITYNAAGGNPTGYVSGSPYFIVLGAGTVYLYFYFVAPGKFLGNRSAYLDGTLRFDLQQSTTNVSIQHAEVIISNGGTSLYYYPTTPFQPLAAPTWTTFSVALNQNAGFWKTTDDPAGTAATNAQISAVLTNLTDLQIRGLFRDANTTNRLDNVTLMPPIIVTTQPSSTAVCDGATTTLTTAATGNATITYQWERQTGPSAWTNVTNTGGYSGAGTVTLSINTTGNFGAATYRCRISGIAANDVYTNTATLTINALPTAPSTTGNSSCIAASLTLSAAGGAAGQYRWYTVPVGGTAIAGQTNGTYTTPVLSVTTTYYVAINNGTCQSTRTAVTATINTPPAAPSTTGSTSCGPASLNLSAAGGVAGQYRWYTVSTGGTAIAGQTNNNYATPIVVTTTIYYVAINNGPCESTRTSVTATINTLPAAPTTTGGASCTSASVTLSASGGTAGQYRWYTVPTGGTPVAGEVNSTYITPVLTTTTTYYVSVNNGACEGARATVVATIAAPGCGNHPPVIQTTPIFTQIEGIVTLSLVNLISDSDNNIDLSTLTIISPPSSGATATIDKDYNLVIDYAGLAFSGTENITLQVCDIFSACMQQTFSIEVVGSIEIFNAVSPNNDGKNEAFVIEHIEQLNDTRKNHVTIYSRWGDLVWEGFNYDNVSVVFTGKSSSNNDLPSGTYFFKIDFSSGAKAQTGFLYLKR